MVREQSLSIVWCFRQSISLTFRNFFDFFYAAFLASLFSVVSFGLMFPCLMTGLESMYLRAKAGDKVKITDVFVHRSKWGALFWQSVVLAWHAGWPIMVFSLAISILSPIFSKNVNPQYAPIIGTFCGVAYIPVVLWSIYRESKHLHALNLAAEFGLTGADSRRVSTLSAKRKWKNTFFAVLAPPMCLLPLILFLMLLVALLPLILFFTFSMVLIPPLLLLPFALLLQTLTMGATAMAFLHDLGEKQEILELVEKYQEKYKKNLEEYKKPVGDPENPCPTCGNSNVRWAYIEDGGRGDWCPDCKMSLKMMRGLV